MTFVLDASVAASWAFPDENDPNATGALLRIADEPAEAPALWWYEVRNTLVVNERRGRITEAQTAAFLSKLAQLPVVLDRGAVEAEVLRLARRHRLSVYDASYLELALRKGLDLASLDRQLVAAAQAEAVKIVGQGA